MSESITLFSHKHISKSKEGSVVCLIVPPSPDSRPERERVDLVHVAKNKKDSKPNFLDFRIGSERTMGFKLDHESQFAPAADGSYCVLWSNTGDPSPAFEHGCSKNVIGEAIILKVVGLDVRRMEFLDMPEEFEEPAVYKELFYAINEH